MAECVTKFINDNKSIITFTSYDSIQPKAVIFAI